MTTLTVAVTQMACGVEREPNLDRAEALVRRAAAAGAQIVLLQELFEGPYFCQDERPEHFARARPIEGHPTVERMAALARELQVVLPVSVFERANNAHYNAIAIVDADGSLLGVYRKAHIPDGPGYEEKYYFNPGDTGFRVWPTRYGTIGVGICWDQWFPECARIMALMGAEMLLYPTAIGSEPLEPEADTCAHWQTVMRGHAGANLMPLVASNRIGTERGLNGGEVTFYGSSFICDARGQMMAEAGRHEEAVVLASFDLEALRTQRAAWGVFRDRRPDLYRPLLSLDGCTIDN